MRVISSSRRQRSTTSKMKLFKFRHHFMKYQSTKLSEESTSKPTTVQWRLSTLINGWSLIHLIMMFICILSHCIPALININDVNNKLMYQTNNKTLIKHKNINLIHYDWCSSSSHFVEHIDSYTIVNRFVIILGLICCAMLIIGLLIYFNLKKKLITNSSQDFWYGLIMFIMFVGSTICNQLFSSLTCRPIEILYDKRFTSMIGIQMLGIIVCLQLAYTLGSTLTPLFDQLENTSSKLDSIDTLFP